MGGLVFLIVTLRVFTRRPRSIAFGKPMSIRRLLLFLFVPVTFAFGADGSHDTSPYSVLADQVRAISSSRSSDRAKHKAIASAVRFAILAATEDVRNPAQVLKIALEFATAAGKASPGYADAVVEGASGIPALAELDGSAAMLQAAVTDAAKAASESDIETSHGQNPRPPENPEFGGSTGDVIVSPST
jgi:hypothetical protein